MSRSIRHINLTLLIGGILMALFLISCEDDVEKGSFIQESELNISSYLEEAEDYSNFTGFLVETGLFDALNSYNPYGNGAFTVFVPSDSAIQNYIEESSTYSSLEQLISDREFLSILTGFHIALSSYTSNEFPFGALNDSTLTGDYLSMGVQNSETESFFLVNNYARVINPNIELSNGVIHEIDRVLEPITFSSYDWVKDKGDATIFVDMLEQTGLSDLMGINKITENNKTVRNRYTLLVEPDSVFMKRGIDSFSDLDEKFGTPGLAIDDPENDIYQFAAYHILEKELFIDDMENEVYNTFTSLPVQISAGTDIKINPGFKIIETYVSDGDTIDLDYVPLIYQISNNPTKNGPVHYISEMLEPHKPGSGRVTFHFKSEPAIEALSNEEGAFPFEDPSELEVISWEGVDQMLYVVGTAAEAAWENDFIFLEGPFEFRFTTPRIFPGIYDFLLRLHADNYDNAVIQVYLDDKRIGTNLNLKSNSENDEFVLFNIGEIDFKDYSSHEIRITTIIPGIMILDMIRFEP